MTRRNLQGDVVCYKTENELLLDAKTEKGKAFLAKLDGVTENADENAADEQKKLIKERLSKLPLASLKADAFGNGQNKRIFRRTRMEGTFRNLSRLRNLYFCLPDLPVL